MECPRCGSFAANGGNFCVACGAPLAGERNGTPPSVSRTASTADTAPDNPPERRHLTVMIYDLVGSAALAAPSMVVAPQSTRRLLGSLFEWGDLGVVMVPGIAQPVQAWRVLGPSRVASRFEALRGEGVRPLVGRRTEMQLLLSRCARARV